MSSAEQIIIDVNDGIFALKGVLTYDTISTLWLRGVELITRSAVAIKIDLSQVAHSDSAGVALLIAWLHQAKNQNKTLHFLNLPQQMRAIARVSGLESLLPIEV